MGIDHGRTRLLQPGDQRALQPRAEPGQPGNRRGNRPEAVKPGRRYGQARERHHITSRTGQRPAHAHIPERAHPPRQQCQVRVRGDLLQAHHIRVAGLEERADRRAAGRQPRTGQRDTPPLIFSDATVRSVIDASGRNVTPGYALDLPPARRTLRTRAPRQPGTRRCRTPAR